MIDQDDEVANQNEREDKMVELELEEDIYCFTYFKFINGYDP